LQLHAPRLVLAPDGVRVKFARLVLEQGVIRTAGQRDDAEARGVPADHVEHLAADRTGRAEYRHTEGGLRHRNEYNGRRSCCDSPSGLPWAESLSDAKCVEWDLRCWI